MKLTSKLAKGVILIIFLSLVFTGVLSTLMINRQFNQYLYAEHDQVMGKIVEEVQSMVNSPDKMDLTKIDFLAHSENHIIEIQDSQNKTLFLSSNFVKAGMMGRRLSLTQIQNMPMYRGFAVESLVLKGLNDERYLLSIAYDNSFKTGAEVDKFKSTMYTSILIAMLLSGMVGVFFSNFVTKPIAKSVLIASENAKLITDGKEISNKIERTHIIELDSLHSSIASLYESLQQQESLRKGLVETLSHEVKTPLTVLSSHIDAFIDGVFTVNSNTLLKCKEEVSRIETLMSKIEVINDLSAEGIVLNLSTFDLREEIISIGTILEPQFRKKSIQIVTKFSGDPLVELDKYKLRQILYNLLSNALKFSRSETTVKLFGLSDDVATKISVENTGLIIEDSDEKQIFNPYYRAPNANTFDRNGKGLGLRISLNLIEAMGGTIQLVKSDAESTIFELTIPKQ